MPRIEIDTTLNRNDGTVAAGATARFRRRGTATDISVYAAATGGSPVSQPITADAEGRIAGFLETDGIAANLGIDIVYIVDGVTYTEPWSGTPNAFTWTTPTLSGTWANFGGAFAGAAYGKTAEGLVVLRGLIKSGTIGTAAFTLPTGFRPAADKRFGVISNGAAGRVDISTAGVVTPSTGNNAYVTLNDIRFAANV